MTWLAYLGLVCCGSCNAWFAWSGGLSCVATLKRPERSIRQATHGLEPIALTLNFGRRTVQSLLLLAMVLLVLGTLPPSAVAFA